MRTRSEIPTNVGHIMAAAYRLLLLREPAKGGISLRRIRPCALSSGEGDIDPSLSALFRERPLFGAALCRASATACASSPRRAVAALALDEALSLVREGPLDLLANIGESIGDN